MRPVCEFSMNILSDACFLGSLDLTGASAVRSIIFSHMLSRGFSSELVSVLMFSFDSFWTLLLLVCISYCCSRDPPNVLPGMNRGCSTFLGEKVFDSIYECISLNFPNISPSARALDISWKGRLRALPVSFFCVFVWLFFYASGGLPVVYASQNEFVLINVLLYCHLFGVVSFDADCALLSGLRKLCCCYCACGLLGLLSWLSTCVDIICSLFIWLTLSANFSVWLREFIMRAKLTGPGLLYAGLTSSHCACLFKI